MASSEVTERTATTQPSGRSPPCTPPARTSGRPRHAGRPDVGQDAERLPELAVQAGLADLVLEDRVGVAQRVQALLGRLAADDADGQAGAGERLAPDEALGQAELGADRPDLVLEQR